MTPDTKQFFHLSGIDTKILKLNAEVYRIQAAN